MILIDDPNLINLYPKDNSRVGGPFGPYLFKYLDPKRIKNKKSPQNTKKRPVWAHFSNKYPPLRGVGPLVAPTYRTCLKGAVKALNLLEMAPNYPKNRQNNPKKPQKQ